MSQHDLETIELSIEDAKAQIAMKDALEKLTRNRDFKKLILDEYFEKNAIRLVMLKSSPVAQGSAEVHDGVLREMDAIGSLRQYFAGVMRNGTIAEKSLRDYEETREELLSEAAE
jgi:hypothetical protein